MMKTFKILLLVQLILISCKTEKKDKSNLIEQNQIESLKENSTESKSIDNEFNDILKIDSIRIKNYAQMILENKIQPTDDEQTFECINQMFTENEKDLNFYFKVFRVILKKSDGALSESIGGFAMSFLKYNPDFFIENFSSFENAEKERFVGFIAYEIYFENDSKTEVDNYISKVENRLIDKSDLKIGILMEIKKSLVKEVENIINE
jgi:hypothetical protein